jgi:hypothetical protein
LSYVIVQGQRTREQDNLPVETPCIYIRRLRSSSPKPQLAPLCPEDPLRLGRG